MLAILICWPNRSAGQALNAQLRPASSYLGIGDAAADLVFTPLAPCRLIDTRLAAGPFVSGETRSYNVIGPTSYTGIGGNAAGCGIPGTTTPVGAGTVGNAVRALVLNFAAVAPAAGGHVLAWPSDQAPPVASVLNFTLGVFAIANGLTVATCTEAVPVGMSPCLNDLSVQVVGGPVHIVADVLGYYAPQNHVLAKHRTLFGTFGIDFVAASPLQEASTTFLFHPPLSTGLIVPEIVFAGFPSTANCPGSISDPRASPGYLCLYESANLNVDQWCVGHLLGEWKCYSADPVLDPIGAIVKITAKAAGRSASMGVWAVTEP